MSRHQRGRVQRAGLPVIAGEQTAESAEREPIVESSKGVRPLGAETWDPSPEYLQRVADLAARTEAALRAGTLVEFMSRDRGGAR